MRINWELAIQISDQFELLRSRKIDCDVPTFMSWELANQMSDQFESLRSRNNVKKEFSSQVVTPLGALSIIESNVLAHSLLNVKLRKMGILGSVLCIVGSTIIVVHAPSEHSVISVEEIWDLATQPAFLLYTSTAIAVVLVLVLYYEPLYGLTNMMVYIGVCSINGSLTVMSVKAICIAIKLTLEGSSQVARYQAWISVTVAVTCIIIQLNYLNKALNTFNTAVVSPLYYAMFTSFTILASATMFKGWSGQSASTIISIICRFMIVLSGTMILHSTRDPDPSPVSWWSGYPFNIYYIPLVYRLIEEEIVRCDNEIMYMDGDELSHLCMALERP
ncbi:probable magnesium transporter NIPA6 [Rutidosis leptorrhynchoides]|uniref:probable magnesium transporter NIPA6 n=1 Tax=Rutidosis leptorrhynchoides TaxID=125765 RepID=UPI003A9A0343